ncbi:MAG: tetratricopeptide repeat protein [Anaerolineae bacterium]|nr:tetratricopeptide repeat protein [Anaerolineae bacterium]
MKRLALAVFWVLLVTIPHLRAQDETPTYRLHAPTPQEFIDGQPSLLLPPVDMMFDDYPCFTQVDHDLMNLLEAEFFFRYGDIMNAELLYTLYDSLDIYVSGDLGAGCSTLDNTWHPEVVRQWFQENPTDLDTVYDLHILTYEIGVESYDFTNDGQNEWLLYVTGGGRGYTSIWTAERDADAPGGYEIKEAVPYTVSDTNYADPHGGSSTVVNFRDLNADGLPEMVFLRYGIKAWPPTVIWYRSEFYVFGWRDDGFHILTSDLPSSLSDGPDPVIGGEFINLDDDPALELVYRERQKDNFWCFWSMKSIYDWDGVQYVKIEEYGDYDYYEDSVSCLIHQAEDAAWHWNDGTWEWENDYEAAIPFYEKAIAIHKQAREEVDRLGERALDRFHDTDQVGYAYERLILAYFTTGRDAEAYALLDELRAEVDRHPRYPIVQDGTIAAAMVEVPLEKVNAYNLCRVAYHYLDDNEFGAEGYRGIEGVGHILDKRGSPSWLSAGHHQSPNPLRGGCDISYMIDQLITGPAFYTGEPPATQLAALGIEIAQTFSADLNGDGQDEWLVWPDELVNPVLFASGGDIYRVSRPELNLAFTPEGDIHWLGDSFETRPMHEDTQLTTRSLPDGAGQALVMYVVAGEDPYYPGFFCEDAEGRFHAPGHVEFWQLQGGMLVRMLEIPLCEVRALDDLFPNDYEIHAWTEPPGDGYYGRSSVPAIYTWDATHTTYVSSFAEAEPTPVPTPDVETISPYGAHSQAIDALESGEFEDALAALDDVLSREDDIDPGDLLKFRYERALMVEALGREDEALAAYVALYTDAPESAWGILARLHLEPSEE